MDNKFVNAYLETFKISLSPEAKSSLNSFDGRALYPATVERSIMTPPRHRIFVGKISWLISRMNDAGADESELVRAIEHLLVLVDSQKYILDWYKSAEDNGVEELMQKYPRKTRQDVTDEELNILVKTTYLLRKYQRY